MNAQNIPRVDSPIKLMTNRDKCTVIKVKGQWVVVRAGIVSSIPDRHVLLPLIGTDEQQICLAETEAAPEKYVIDGHRIWLKSFFLRIYPHSGGVAETPENMLYATISPRNGHTEGL